MVAPRGRLLPSHASPTGRRCPPRASDAAGSITPTAPSQGSSRSTVYRAEGHRVHPTEPATTTGLELLLAAFYQPVVKRLAKRGAGRDGARP